MLAEKQLDLNVRVRANAGRIECDERRLSASLHHLLSNSINFTPAGGRVMVLAEGSREGVRINVYESGIGIAPAQQERVFSAFNREAEGVVSSLGRLWLGVVSRFVSDRQRDWWRKRVDV